MTTPCRLAEFVTEFENDFGWLGQEDCQLTEKFEMEFDCNWKLIVENLLDFYHVAALHQDTIGHGFDVALMPLNNKPKGRFSSFYERASPMLGGKPLLDVLPALASKPGAGNGPIASAFCHRILISSFDQTMCGPSLSGRCHRRNANSSPIRYFPEKRSTNRDLPAAVESYRVLHEATLVEDLEMVRSLQNACEFTQLRARPNIHNGGSRPQHVDLVFRPDVWIEFDPAQNNSRHRHYVARPSHGSDDRRRTKDPLSEHSPIDGADRAKVQPGFLAKCQVKVPNFQPMDVDISYVKEKRSWLIKSEVTSRFIVMTYRALQLRDGSFGFTRVHVHHNAMPSNLQRTFTQMINGIRNYARPKRTTPGRSLAQGDSLFAGGSTNFLSRFSRACRQRIGWSALAAT